MVIRSSVVSVSSVMVVVMVVCVVRFRVWKVMFFVLGWDL